MNKQLEKHIKSEIRFLGSTPIRQLILDADIESCHMDCQAIQNRIKKLKLALKR